MIKAAIIGNNRASTGELITILKNHPDVEVVAVDVPEANGTRVDAVFRPLRGECNLMMNALDTSIDADVLFIVMPIDEARERIPSTEGHEELRVIAVCDGDVPTDDFLYALPECNRRTIVHDITRVACPSASANVIALGLLPLARNLLINGDIVAELNSNIPVDTEHTSHELNDVLSSLQSSFNSHITITTTGITGNEIVARIKIACNVDIEIITDLFKQYYDDHNFTFVTGDVKTGDVSGTNKAFIALEKDGSVLIVTVAIDTRYKGSIGTAVHNMNLLFGLHERVGLMLQPDF